MAPYLEGPTMTLQQKIDQAHSLASTLYNERQRHDKLLEEAFELCAALMKTRNKSVFESERAHDEMINEMCDVYIVTSELMANYCDSHTIHKILDKKYDKFISRMLEDKGGLHG